MQAGHATESMSEFRCEYIHYRIHHSCLFHGGANTILGVAVAKTFLNVLKG